MKALEDGQLKNILTDFEYFNLCEHEGIVYGLSNYMFTTGIVVGLTKFFYERRYCYPDLRSASDGLIQWAARDFKDHPPGPWIKVKGSYKGEPIDELNPEYHDTN